MRLAITVWNGRIAPVFDVAGTVRLVELTENTVTQDQLVSLPSDRGIFSRVALVILYQWALVAFLLRPSVPGREIPRALILL